MVDVSKLRGKIVEKNTNQENLALEIGMTRSTFYRKMKQNGNFTINEVNKIVESLGLTKDEAIAIFFANTVA